MRQYSDQEVESLVQQLPQPIQDSLTGPDMAMKVANIGSRAGLHIDQIGLLAQLNRNLLLGLVRPPEFLQGLLETGISRENANKVIAEINEKIFTPLHDEVMGATKREREPNTVAPAVAVPHYEATPLPPRGMQDQAAPAMPFAAPQPAPSAPLPPRSVMPGAAPTTPAYVPQKLIQLEQMQVRRPQAASVPASISASPQTPQTPQIPPPEFTSLYTAPQPIEHVRQAEPPAPPPNLPGIYGSVLVFAQTPHADPTPAPAPYAPPVLEEQYPGAAAEQSVVPVLPSYMPQRAPAKMSAATQRAPLAVTPSAPVQSEALPLTVPQPASPSPSNDSTDPYREPIG